jgi:starvation-inducible DNA-binding protein
MTQRPPAVPPAETAADAATEEGASAQPAEPGHADWLLDESLRETFPASDPISPAAQPRATAGAPAPAAPRVPERPSTMKKTSGEVSSLKVRQRAPLATPTDLRGDAGPAVATVMNAVLADVFALYMKTKNFHWHMSGPHFRDYHLLLDEQADQLFAMTDPIAERVRKLGGMTLHSIGHVARLQRILDNDADYVEPLDMLAELREDNQTLATHLRDAHEVCEEHRDIATASLIENWIDETERRAWFLFESSRRQDSGAH